MIQYFPHVRYLLRVVTGAGLALTVVGCSASAKTGPDSQAGGAGDAEGGDAPGQDPDGRGDGGATGSPTGIPDTGGTSSSSCTGGADIDESSVDITWIVGADAADHPTLQDAVIAALPEVQEAGKTVKLLLQRGIYREQVTLHGDGSQAGTLIIEAEQPGTAIISGADVFSEWTPSRHAGIYEHAWDKDWGYVVNGCRDRFGNGDYKTYPDARKELFFIDGKPLSQKRLPASPNPHDIDTVASLPAGSFVIDEAADKVFLHPPEGISLANARVEGAMRPENEDFGVFKVHNFNNLVLRGLTVTQAANAAHAAMRIGPADNILIENCDFSRNNGVGIALSGTRATIRNVTAHENGRKGLGLSGKHIVIDGLAANWNNWKMAEWNYTECTVAGVKAGDLHDSCIANVATVGNSAPGFWIDVWSNNVQVEHLATLGNRKQGFDWEISRGIQVSNLLSMYNDVGWLSYDGMEVTLRDSVIANNRTVQVMASETDRAKDGVSYDSRDWTIEQCTIAAPEGNGNLLIDWWPHKLAQVGAHEGWARFAQTLTATNNIYFHPRTRQVFRHPDGPNVDFQRWQELSGEDSHSEWDRESAAQKVRQANDALRSVWRSATDYELGYHEREPDVEFVDH